MEYQALKSGDILKYGDEQRQKDAGHVVSPGKDYTPKPGAWNNNIMINRKVIGGDLAHLEFRRPIKS